MDVGYFLQKNAEKDDMVKFSGRQYEAVANKTQVMTPGRFVNLTDAQRAGIVSTTIVPPKLGSKGFGGIRVTFRDQVYRVVGVDK